MTRPSGGPTPLAERFRTWRIVEAIEDVGWAAGWGLVGRLPERFVLGGFGLAADLVWRGHGKQVRRLESNLARVCPDATPLELRKLSRIGLRSYLRYWAEAFRLHRMSAQDVLDRVVVHNEEMFWKPLREGQGVVAALPHQANWDLAAAWVQASGGSLTTVAERLRPEKLFARFVAYREVLGMEILPLTGGEDPFGTLGERLRQGRLVALVADRDLSERGVEVDFFGSKARMPAGPAALHIRTGAVLIPVTMWYEDLTGARRSRMHIRFHDPVERRRNGGPAIRDLTQQVADVFAEGIAAHPEDWHMLQRLWLADLERPPTMRKR